jgi:ribosome-binding factor A
LLRVDGLPGVRRRPWGASRSRDVLCDPRGEVNITRVELSSDHKHARVHVSHLEDDEEARRRILGRLIDRVGAIKHYMAEQLDLKYIPELRFEEDTSIREAARLSSIMD